MCPPEPVDKNIRKKILADHQTGLKGLEIESKDQSSYLKTRKRLKGSGEQLEMVLKLKRS